MPLYDFRCRCCGTEFEALAAPGTLPPCPSCGATEAQRQFSAISKPPRFGLRGADARRSDASRRAREERRREERGQRRGRDSSG